MPVSLFVAWLQCKSSRGNDAIWHIVLSAFAVCVMPLELGIEEWLWHLH